MGAYGIAGDPAGMRALAGYLTGIADTLGGRSSSLSGPVACMTFEGPAATAFRGRMADWQQAAVGEAGKLQDLAGRLRTAADTVEREQHAAERRAFEELARAKEHALQP
jgi:uncharacterized protein YukE